jgi:hypothetical protein
MSDCNWSSSRAFTAPSGKRNLPRRWGIVIPANWITASLSFQASPDGGATWGELLTSAGAAYAIGSVTGGAQERIAVDPTALLGVRSLKVRSGTPASPTNQVNTVNVILLTRQIF